MKRRVWSEADISRLFAMRDVLKLTWRQIGEAFNDSFTSCCTRYFYYKDKKRIESLRAGEAVEPRQRRARKTPRWSTPLAPPKKFNRVAKAPATPPPQAEPKIAAPSVPIIKRPRYFHEADMDIIARIDRQGLTSGFLGDPPAGRSALDQKRSPRSAACCLTVLSLP